MRTSLSFLLLTGTTAVACSAPQVDLDAEREHLEARAAGIVAAEVAQDTEAAMAFWTQDAIVQPAGAPLVEGYEAVRAMYEEFFSLPIKEFDSYTTRRELAMAGDMAWEYGVNRLTLTGPDGDALDLGKYIAVWHKIDGEWYIAALSFTSDAPVPVPVEE